MATINIGNLTFTHKGDYNGSTAYAKNDVVYYSTNGNAYIAKQATTGNAPTNATYWNQFAAGSGGIWNAGLSLGSAGQIVKVNSGASALEFGDASASGVVQVKTAFLSENVAISGVTKNDYTQVPTGTWSLNFTPTSASNKVLLIVNASISNITSSANRVRISLWRDSTIVGGNTTTLGNRRYAIAGSYHNDDREIGSWGFVHLDNPNTTSQVNYNFKMNTDGTSGGNVAYINRSANDHNDGGQPRMSSNLVAMEIDSGVL